MSLRFQRPRLDDLYAAPELAAVAILEAAADIAVAALLAIHPDDPDLNDEPLPPERRAAWALAQAARDVGSAIHRYRLALLVARERERNDLLPF